ncbi:MAG: hypothetical protein MZW92_79235 [Comamonadaceae bacterium]|nr:hypothetical protein [Comamonadaceae bacterium]
MASVPPSTERNCTQSRQRQRSPAARSASATCKERVIEAMLFLAASVSVFTTVGIVYILVKESVGVLQHVSIVDFLTDTQWTPLFDDAHFGIMVLLSGTLTSSARRACGGDPAGHHHRDLPVRVRAASGCARSPSRSSSCWAACRPSSTATSRCCSSRRCCRRSIPGLPGFNLLSAGLVMGIMIIPYVSSLSRGRDARGADGAARGLLRDGRDALADGAPGGRCRRRSRASPRPTSSASRAPSARP